MMLRAGLCVCLQILGTPGSNAVYQMYRGDAVLLVSTTLLAMCWLATAAMSSLLLVAPSLPSPSSRHTLVYLLDAV